MGDTDSNVIWFINFFVKISASASAIQATTNILIAEAVYAESLNKLLDFCWVFFDHEQFILSSYLVWGKQNLNRTEWPLKKFSMHS